MKRTHAITMSAILLLAIAPLISGAYANPGHSVTKSPGILAPGDTTFIDIRVSAAINPDIYGPRTFILKDPNENALLPATSFVGCMAYAKEEATDRLWNLEDAEGENVGAFFPAATIGAVEDISFGDGDPATNPPFAVTGAAVVYDPEDGGTGDAPEAPVVWNEDVGGAADDTFGPGLYAIMSCGFEDNDSDGAFTPGVDTQGVVVETFRVTKPVGGEILPINTTALLIAGISSNAFWILPALATVAVGSFALLKFQVTKKNN